MAKKNVLIVDDDISILRLLEAALKKNDFDVLKASSGEEAIGILESHPVHAVVLDVMLPGMDGLETLKVIRNHPLHKSVPVLMLTSRNEEIDNVIGLELGADDYIGKPIRYHELIARIKAVLRRAGENSESLSKKLVVGNLQIDLSFRTVRLNDYEIPLSFKEFELLCLLAKKPGKVFTRDEILDMVWKEEYFLETRTVDVHIRRIRRKFEKVAQSAVVIDTIRNVGYRLIAM
ncbi:response regulator transcription factor [Petroclostridium sp. X23]|uniref:response regulator transcription factor n=1 Tax=Petroclostridium sp. X23 TaxID=3045146 RepID=UPI0024AD7911|nr:response regulator transcription factor [Petroclostridium sp. X23]WHH57475.1 response regulator transcription factor [Petroclostridium sp. X23]